MAQLPLNKGQALSGSIGAAAAPGQPNKGNVMGGLAVAVPTAGAGFIQERGGNNIFVGEAKPSDGTNGYVTTSITDLQQRVARLEELVARLIGARE